MVMVFSFTFNNIQAIHKGENTLYEEVEDAATSCSIEGSSNVKFLIARGRNINKSRIEQINEEWKTGKPLIKHMID
jgi:hypothetical protein